MYLYKHQMGDTEGRSEAANDAQFLNDLTFCPLRDNQAQNMNSSLLSICDDGC